MTQARVSSAQPTAADAPTTGAAAEAGVAAAGGGCGRPMSPSDSTCPSMQNKLTAPNDISFSFT